MMAEGFAVYCSIAVPCFAVMLKESVLQNELEDGMWLG